MLILGPLGFTTPWLLAALLALPILWFLLRAVPPAPIRRRFPGVALLLGLTDDETQTDRTPWWLLLIRMLAVAAVILGFAGPVLNPEPPDGGRGPLLALIDGGWADAADWQRRMDRVETLLDEAGRAGRPVSVVTLTELPAAGLPFQAAGVWASRLPGVAPKPWEPRAEDVTRWAASLDGAFDTLWLSNGLAADWRESLLDALEGHGEVRVFESPRTLLGLKPPRFEGGIVTVPVLRARAGTPQSVEVAAQGTDPAGAERELARATASFAADATATEVELSLPPELRNRITRFELPGVRSAGAVSLTDDALRRREVALIAGTADREGLQLLSPLHYLRQALEPTADLIDGALSDILLADPDVIILADVGQIAEKDELLAWVEDGGLLVRFAGPRLAASDLSRGVEDPLVPVRLRIGGRTVGGAMSWGQPKALRPFEEGSPFFGLPVPEDVRVSAQVMAEPDPDLAERTIASLADGTPLVTRKVVGEGGVVLFHVTASPEWSTLPLSGLFVQMLDRLAISSRPADLSAEELAGTIWTPDTVLTAFGAVEPADDLSAIPGERLAEGRPGPDAPPGLYTGEDRRVALNVLGPDAELRPATWPAHIVVEGLAVARSLPLKGILLGLALALLFADLVASLLLSGLIRGATRAGTAALLAVVLLAPPGPAEAQDEAVMRAAAGVALGHVVTGDAELDRVAEAGMRGLAQVLWQRTSVETAEPIAVDLETDELSVFPLLYWPISVDQPIPSDEAYAKLNHYLRTGGMIVFDTRDAGLGFGGTTPEGRKLQQLAAPLDIPPLEPVPEDHVLTRSFYLLQDFPGRYDRGTVWVEAAPPDAERVEGMPFRNLNDNVTPVVIGANDWASAWALDESGRWMFPVGRGYAGERQREMALRFGVNLVMHVLTGNYKSDQVHVPALLERLGQ